MRHQRRDFRSRCTRNKSLDATDPKSRSGAAIFMETCLGILFSHVFCNESPYAESVILHFSKRSVEAVLRPRSNAILQKRLSFKKTFLFLCFAFRGILYRIPQRKPRFGARLGGAILHRSICKFICKNLRNYLHWPGPILLLSGVSVAGCGRGWHWEIHAL